MKKTILVLVGTVALVAIVVNYAQKDSNVSEQTIVQANEVASTEAVSNTATNLHFKNLHVNPQVQ